VVVSGGEALRGEEPRHPSRGRFLPRLAAALAAAAAMTDGLASAPFASHLLAGDPDALWQIVSTCIDERSDPQAALCSCPALVHSCCDDAGTPDGDVVWSKTAQFVAIRDLVACGCPGSFVAGLALPRTRITGIEDPARPDAIWPFAWQVARSRIPAEVEIGLAINPIDARSQNQMHVHMLRLKPGVRAAIEGARASGRLADPAGTVVVALPDLSGVFAAAAARVGASEMGLHGILVVAARDGGFLAAITDRRSPQAFTVNRCR